MRARFHVPSLLGTILLLSLLGAADRIHSQETSLSGDAKRYFEMLRQRPQAGVVFERFTDAWLASGTADELRNFLTSRADEPKASAVDHLILALFHARQGDETKALAAFGKALELAPTNGAAWLERARLEVRVLDFNAALKSLDAGLAQKPSDKLAMDLGKLRGRVLLRTGKPEDALKAWRALLETHPDDEDLAEELVEVQLDEGLASEAANTLRALIGKTQDAHAKMSRKLWLADILQRAGNRAEALTVLGECLAQSGRETWIEGETLAQIDRLFRREDNLTGLREHLAKLASADPTRVALQWQLGRIQAETGEKDQALTTYSTLLTRTPGRRDLRESYLDLLERIEKFADAIKQTKLLIEQNPGDKELQLRLASLHQQAKEEKAADAALAAFLATPGTSESDHLRVARLLEQWGRPKDAKVGFARLVTIFPESTSAKEAQAQFLHRTGEREAALAIWRNLAAKGDLGDLLAVANALLARLEPQAAMEILRARFAEFSQEPRFLAPLVAAAHAVKKDKEAAPWALERLRLTREAALLDDAIRQATDVLEGAGALEETRASLQKAANPAFPERALLATLLERSGNREASETTLRKAPAEQAGLAQERLVRLLESRQDWPRAAVELEKLISMPEGRTSQHLQRLVDLRQRAGEPEVALKLIADWKALSPGAIQPWLTESAILSQLGKTPESIRVLRAASRKFDGDANVASALASACGAAGQYADAETIYLKLVDKSDTTEEKLRWVAALAQVAASRGRVKDLVERFQERQRTNREDAVPWLALARVHQAAGNSIEQLRCLNEAARHRKADVALLQEIARVQEEIGQTKEALRTLERAAALDSTPRTKHLIVSAKLRFGDENEAFQNLIALFGGSQMEAKEALKLAGAMASREMWKRTVEFLDPFLEREPGDYRLRYLRAVSKSENGQNEAAVADFLHIATHTEELPEVLQLSSSVKTPSAEVLERYEKHYPPGMMEFLGISQSAYKALQHVYARQQGGSQSNRVSVQLPSSVLEARRFSMIYLITFSREMKAPDRERLLLELRESGWKSVEMLFALEPGSRDWGFWNQRLPDEFVRTHPDDLLAHAAWIQLSSNTDQTSASLDLCQRASLLFKEKYPRLAMTASVLAVRSDLKAGLPLLEEAVNRLTAQQDAEDDDYLSSSTYHFASLLGGGQQVQLEKRLELPDPIRKKIRDLIVRAAKPRKDKKTGAPSTWSSANAIFPANALRADGAWEEYIQLWENEFERLRSADATQRLAFTTWPYQSYGGNRSAPLFAPLEFPPLCQALPASFAMMMRHTDPFNPHIGGNTGAEDDFAGVVPFLDRIKDPVLALVLAYKTGQTARVESGLEKLVASGSPDAALLAASYYGTKGNNSRAVELLVRCASLPMDAAQRMAVDSALVTSVTGLSDSDRKSLNPAVMEASQQAARRFRSGKLSPEQGEELAGVLTKLGLKDEAEQWKKLLAAAPVPAAPQQVYYSRPTATPGRLDQLIAQKAEEGAILREAIQQLRSVISNWGNLFADYTHREAKRSVLDKLTFPDAKKKLVALIEEGTGEARRLEAAKLLTVTEELDRALAVYQSVSDANPRQTEARTGVILLTAMRDETKAMALVRELPWKTLAEGAGISILNELNDSYFPFSARMKLVEAFGQYLNRLAESTPPPLSALDWAKNLPTVAANYINQPGISSLYRRGDNQNTSRPEAQRRRQVHDAVCRTLLKHPSIAAEGFRGLAGLAISEAKDLAEFDPLAERLLKEAQAEKATGAVYRGPSQNWRWGTNNDEIWRPEPAEFLIWQAVKSGHPERIESEILPLAAGSRSPAEMKILRARTNLWTCAPETFPAAANALLSVGANNEPLVMDVLRCWEERKLAPDLLDGFFSARVKLSGYFGRSFLGQYFALRAQRAESDTTLTASFRKLTTTLIGPESGWDKKIGDAVERRYGRGSGRWDEGAAAVLETVERMIQESKSQGEGFRLAAQLGLFKHEEWRRNNSYYSMRTVAEKPDRVLEFLAATPFLAEAQGFETWSGNDRNSSSLIRLVEEVKKRNPVREAVQQNLRDRKPRSFGIDFVLAMLETDVPAALSTALKQRAADLERIPDARKPEVARLVSTLIPAVKQPATMDPGLRKALEPVMAAQLQAQESRAETWLKAVRLEELKTSDRTCEEELTRLVWEVAAKDRAKAEALFLHGCQLIEDKQRKQGFNSRASSDGWTVRSDILSEVIENAPRMEILSLSMKLFHEDTTGNLAMNGWSNQSNYGQILIDLWRNSGGQGNNAAGLRALVELTRKELGSTPPTLLALAYYDLFTKLPSNFRVPAIRWAEEPSREATLAPFARELAMAGRLYLASDKGPRNDAAIQKTLEEMGGLAPVWKHYLAQMRDDKINPRVRIALAHHLCYHLPTSVTPEIASMAASLALDAMQQRHSLHSAQYGWILDAWSRAPLDQAWKTAAQAHWDAWIARRAYQSGNQNIRYYSGTWCTLNMLRLACRVGNEEWITRILNDSEDRLDDRPSALAILVSTGRPKEAVEWLKANWDKSVYDPEKGVEWNAEIVAGLPAFREACGSPDLAFLGEVMLAHLPDYKDRAKRYTGLAAKFHGIQFANPAMRTRCLEYFGYHWETCDQLAKEYDAAAATTDLSAILSSRNSWIQFRKLKPLLVSNCQKAWSGNVKPAMDTYSKVIASCDDDFPPRDLGGDPINAAGWKWARTGKGDWNGLLPLCDLILDKTPEKLFNSQIGNALSMKLLIHHASNDAEAVARWRKGLAKDRAGALEKQFGAHLMVWNYLNDMAGLPKHTMPVERRVTIVASLLRDEWIIRRYPEVGQSVPNLMGTLVNSEKVFEPDELGSIWKPLSETAPRKGRTASEAADLLAQRGKLDEAATAMHFAVSQVPEKDYRVAAGYLLREAEFFERAKQAGKARQVLESIDSKRISPSLTDRIAAAMKRLGKDG